MKDNDSMNEYFRTLGARQRKESPFWTYVKAGVVTLAFSAFIVCVLMGMQAVVVDTGRAILHK